MATQVIQPPMEGIMTYYVALHANIADQHRILDFSCTPETALGYARQIEDGEMIVLEATDRLAELLAQTDLKPLRFRITDDGKIDLVTVAEYFAGTPATPAHAEIERLEALADKEGRSVVQPEIDAVHRSIADCSARVDASVSPRAA